MKNKIFSTIFIFSCCIFLLAALEGWMHKPATTDKAVIEQSAKKSILLLQRSGYIFTNNNKFKCASCHNNTLTAITTALAMQKGIPIIDSLATSNYIAMKNTLIGACNPNQINRFLAISFPTPYLLLGMYAAKYPPDINTDISVDYMMSQAKPDGSFLAESGRVPLETGDVHLTAMAIRSIELYASSAKKKRVDELVKKTRQWLEKVQTNQQQELTFQLLGMQWCGSDNNHKRKVAEKLVSMQHADGGWSQLPTLKSDAYATGQTLFALYESGMEKTDGVVYQKGLNYLLNTQGKEGTWFVATRSFPIQPFVPSDFPPYDDNQFISAAGTNWAVMALLNALPDKKR